MTEQEQLLLKSQLLLRCCHCRCKKKGVVSFKCLTYDFVTIFKGRNKTDECVSGGEDDARVAKRVGTAISIAVDSYVPG